MVEPEVYREAQQREKRHPGVGPGWSTQVIHGPAKQQRRHESAQRTQATDDADGRARFLWQHVRDDLEHAAVAQSGRGTDDQDDGEKSGELVRLEESRQAESAQGHCHD